MKQMTFADAEYAGKRKQTRKELFLIEMDRVVPWKVGIPCALGHPVHEHLDSDSTLTWTLIPRPLGH